MVKTNKLLVLSIILLAGALACGRTIGLAPTGSPHMAEDGLASATPSAEQPRLPAGETTRTINHGGLERSYILYIPASVNWSRPVPLVFVFHGGTGNAQSAIRMSGFNGAADRNGFAVAYPNGTGRLSGDILLTWNGGACCGYAQEKNVDDVGFVRAIVADLQSRIPVDPKRIYATGMSNGGILSHRLGCEAADLFAAIAPVSGTLNFSPCHPSRTISVIEFHGTADEHIPYDGGYGPKSLVNVDFASVKDSIGFWTSADGCNSQPQTDTIDTIRHDFWTGCAGSTSVELYTIIGGGHAWPGGLGGLPDSDQPTTVISATQLMWEFFSAHPQP
jgi:polyhydroxybutyrate depolymerase